MRLFAPPRGRFAIGAAAAILWTTCSVGAMPARAAQGSFPQTPSVSSHRLEVPYPASAAASATLAPPASPLVGAPTKVNPAQLQQIGGRKFPALKRSAAGGTHTFSPAAAVAACSGGSLAASSSSVVEGATVSVTASATCPSGTTASYAYWLVSPGGHAQNMTPWTGAAWSWDTAGYAPGAYQIEVWVTNGSTSAGPQTTAFTSVAISSVALGSSQNWSGYVLGDGPFTAAQGTFNIPEIYAAPTNTDTAEWVGVDGWNDSSLIQAGIDEPYNATTNTYRILAWWEILPADPTEVLISTSTLSPQPGDSITVTLGEVSSDTWGIEITDNTNGQSFVTDQLYSAPQSSAEWIVEAPTLDGSIETLGDYAPDVTFTDLGTTGPETVLYDVAMFQARVQVSTPSTLDSTGFTVAYGNLPPPPP